MIKIGIIGYGYWGPNLVRNFFATPNCIVKTVADLIPQRLVELNKFYPTINTTTKIDDILGDSEIDAVVVATPVSTHFKLVKKVLQSNKHAFVEKPMTISLAESEKLIKLAKKKKKILMVDHTFVYKDAIKKIKKLIEIGEIGKLRYFDSMRTNLGLFQSDVNVLWDLAVHDISILLFLTKEKPYSIQASGVSHLKNSKENIAFVTLKYRSGLIAHINVSWSSPVKIRQILIGGSSKMIVFNDVEPTEKVKVYNSGFEVKNRKDQSKMIIDYRVGDIYIPKTATEAKEALADVTRDFVEAIIKGKKPVSDMYFGREVVKILRLAQESLNKGEKPLLYK